MSQAIAQSATQLTVSSVTEENFDFELSAKNAASRQAKGITRERNLLSRNKLTSAVCADYRAHFAAIYGKTDRLPTAVFEKVEKAVDKVIETFLGQVNKLNAISFRRAFHHNATEMEITERVTCTGENKLTLEEQLLGVNLFIGQAERKLRDLEAKPTPDYDREKAVKEQLMRLAVTKQFIQGEISHQDKLKVK